MTPNSVDKREDSNMKTDPRIVSEHKFSSQTYNKERVLIPNFVELTGFSFPLFNYPELHFSNSMCSKTFVL